MPAANAGLSAPSLRASPPRRASDEGARVTLTMVVAVVVPSWAVTTTGIMFAPTASRSAPEGLPDATRVPLTLTVACRSLTLGVTVRLLTPWATVAV